MFTLSRTLRRLRRDKQGASIVEFALIVPAMVMMTVAATDFARVFIEAHAVASASNSGVVFGARRNVDSVNFSEMEARALEDARGASNATATASMFCDCPANPGISVSCTDGTCQGYGQPRVYVRTAVQQQYKTLASYPWIPNSMSLKSTAYMRVQ